MRSKLGPVISPVIVLIRQLELWGSILDKGTVFVLHPGGKAAKVGS